MKVSMCSWVLWQLCSFSPLFPCWAAIRSELSALCPLSTFNPPTPATLCIHGDWNIESTRSFVQLRLLGLGLHYPETSADKRKWDIIFPGQFWRDWGLLWEEAEHTDRRRTEWWFLCLLLLLHCPMTGLRQRGSQAIELKVDVNLIQGIWPRHIHLKCL